MHLLVEAGNERPGVMAPVCPRKQGGDARLQGRGDSIILEAIQTREVAMAPTTTRRTLLASSAILLAGPAAAQPATTLKLYSPNYEAGVARLAFEVPSRTKSRYQIEQIIGFDRMEAALGKERAAGGERALIEGARNGDLDLVVCSTLLLGDYVPEVQVFSIPFLFSDYAHARAVLDGPLGQDVLARFAAHGLVGLAWTEAGFRYLANSKRPIRTPEDLRGIRLRTPPTGTVIEAFGTLGAEVVPMPFGQAVFDGLAQGAFDGMEGDVDTMVNWEVFRSAKYLSQTRHIYAPAIIVMSKAAYDRLSTADRQALVEAARLAGQTERKFVDGAEADGFVRLLSVGMEIADIDKAAFRTALAPVYAKWRQQFGDLIDRIQAYH
jgi:TRAP-type transport system periplasmic protein